MRNKRAYTWVELLIVVLIVSILASLVMPIVRTQIDAAKWSEGKAMAGTIATAIQTWSVGPHRKTGLWTRGSGVSLNDMGLHESDFQGRYFDEGCFDWEISFDGLVLTYLVTVIPPSGIGSPGQITLDSDGEWGN